jgi:hypothetical protein
MVGPCQFEQRLVQHMEGGEGTAEPSDRPDAVAVGVTVRRIERGSLDIRRQIEPIRWSRRDEDSPPCPRFRGHANIRGRKPEGAPR